MPPSLGTLGLTVLELQYSNFSGALPDDIDYDGIPDCALYNDWFLGGRGAFGVFECPLPKGAANCGAVCA